jgi:hypothetical protein
MRAALALALAAIRADPCPNIVAPVGSPSCAPARSRPGWPVLIDRPRAFTTIS